MTIYPNRLGTILAGIVQRPRIFASYHHRGDQMYYNRFSDIIHDQLELAYDQSLERSIDSDNDDYIYDRIREEYLTGTSCTVVLCGAQTHQRKHVDWEIKATLDKKHGVIGLMLPSLPVQPGGTVHVPARLSANISTGYAVWKSWNDFVLNPAVLKTWIEDAKSRPKNLIDNSLLMKRTNG
jgi:hypothetical protein